MPRMFLIHALHIHDHCIFLLTQQISILVHVIWCGFLKPGAYTSFNAPLLLRNGLTKGITILTIFLLRDVRFACFDRINCMTRTPYARRAVSIKTDERYYSLGTRIAPLRMYQSPKIITSTLAAVD